MSWTRPTRRPPWLIIFPEAIRTPVVIGARIIFAAFLVFLAIAGFYFFLSLKYSMDEVTKTPPQITLLDCHGNEVTTLRPLGGQQVQRKDIPEHLVSALLAREDARFFQHRGVDTRGILRATIRNIKDGSLTQGASTLSMQLTRNIFELREKSLHRKCLEIALTLRLETYYTKDEILTNYLNRIYFGSGCYGIEQAAQKYFGKSTSNLNLSESALIVGIIRGPHIFSPLRNPELAKEQRDQTLKRMLATAAVSEAQYENAFHSNIELTETEENTHQSYAISSVKRHLQVIMDKQDIRENGLRVYTSIDLKKNTTLQKFLKDSLTPLSKADKELQTAAVCIEHASGAIRCLTGGTSFATSRYNRALDARRDIGQLLTPFIDLAALERNRTPILHKPLLTGRQIGPEETIRILKRLGLKGPFQQNEDLFRGGAAATPLELGTAYSTLAAKGNRPHTYFIQKIELSDGTQIFKNTPTPSSIAVTENATRSLLSIPYKENTKTYQISGSTGSQRDFWHLRITPETTLLLWIGMDTPEKLPIEQLKSITKDLPL